MSPIAENEPKTPTSTEKSMKVVLLGASGSGKTCLLNKFVNDEFNPEEITTVACDYGERVVRLEDQRCVNVIVWDTAGLDRFQRLAETYYHECKAAVICFDLASEDSYKKAQFWMNELTEKEPNCKKYLCGTKTDMMNVGALKRFDDNILHITDFANRADAVYFEVSSKTGENVDEMFRLMVKDFLSYPQTVVDVENVSLASRPSSRVSKGKSMCCCFC